MPVQKRKVTIFQTGWNPSSSTISLAFPSRLNCSRELFPENSEAASLKPSVRAWLQTPKCNMPLRGAKLSPCLCGLFKKDSKRIFPSFSKKNTRLSNHRVNLMLEALCVCGRSLVRHDLYSRRGLDHAFLVILLTVQIVQRRRTRIS